MCRTRRGIPMSTPSIGFVAMIPFLVTAWYVGPVAASMGDVDAGRSTPVET